MQFIYCKKKQKKSKNSNSKTLSPKNEAAENGTNVYDELCMQNSTNALMGHSKWKIKHGATKENWLT